MLLTYSKSAGVNHLVAFFFHKSHVEAWALDKKKIRKTAGMLHTN